MLYYVIARIYCMHAHVLVSTLHSETVMLCSRVPIRYTYEFLLSGCPTVKRNLIGTNVTVHAAVHQ